MKKLMTILIFVVMLFPIVASAAVDWTSLSEEEIQQEIDFAKTELFSRSIKTNEKGTMLFESDGVIVTLNSTELVKCYDDSFKLVINYTVANNSNREIGVSTQDIYLNGWEVSSLLYTTLDAGKKAKDQAEIYHVDTLADVTCEEELEALEIHFEIFDANTFVTIARNIHATIYFNK